MPTRFAMNRNRILFGAAALFLIWLGGSLALHFGQKYHDRLGYDIDQQFPPDKPTVPGEIYASTLAAIMDHELHTGFGWRPNDLWFWGPKVGADNNADRQLGIIQAVRETMRIFKDHLTKVSSNQYDPNLVIADTDFRNDALKWILPSPEGKYDDGIEHLRMYVAGLHTTPPDSRELNTRAVELISLLQTWTDLLGDAHANLYRTTKDDGSAGAQLGLRSLFLSRAGLHARDVPHDAGDRARILGPVQGRPGAEDAAGRRD